MENENIISMDKNACCFVTLETVDLIDIFIRPVYKQIIVHTLNHFISSKGLVVYGWCLMPSKLYLVCQSQKNIDFKELRWEFKQFTSEKVMEAIGNEPKERQDWLKEHFVKSSGFLGSVKSFEVWKRVKELVSFDPSRPENMAEFLELLHNVPVQERIVRYASDYIYSSAMDYETGTVGLVKITMMSAVEAELSGMQNRKSFFKTNFK